MTHEEKALIEFLSDNGLDIFSIKDLENIEVLASKNVEIALRSLINKGFIHVIEKGKYCKHDFHSEFSEFVIGTYIIRKGGIGYWNAMNYLGLTEQIPKTIFVQTNQWKKDKTIFGVDYKFIQLKENKLTGYKTVGYGNYTFKITDVEKTIVDCFDLPEYAGGYQEIIKAYYNATINPNKLIKYCKKINNISVIKRLAFLSELFNKPNMDSFRNYALSVRNEKYNPFINYGNLKGKTNRKWRLVINVSRDEIFNMAND